MTTLVLPNGRRIHVRASTKQIRDRLRHPGYIKIGRAMIRRDNVALICVDEEVVEETKRRILSRRYPRVPT